MTVKTNTVVPAVTTREVAQAARDFARQRGMQVGTRGRLSTDLFAEFFRHDRKTAKRVAQSIDLALPKNGAVSKANAQMLALAVR